MLVFSEHVVFCADTTVNIDPTAEQLAQIAYAASRITRTFGIEPRIAMLSFSNFGSVRHPDAEKMAKAVKLLRQRDPTLIVDGEMQADTALDPELLHRDYPFSALGDRANVLIFPNLSAGNIAYKLLDHLGGATAIGPILVGMNRPVHVLERGADVQEIVNMAAVAVVDSQGRSFSTDGAGVSDRSPAPARFLAPLRRAKKGSSRISGKTDRRRLFVAFEWRRVAGRTRAVGPEGDALTRCEPRALGTQRRPGQARESLATRDALRPDTRVLPSGAADGRARSGDGRVRTYQVPPNERRCRP